VVQRRRRTSPIIRSTCRNSLDISLSSSLCLSLPAYAECPVESGGSSIGESIDDQVKKDDATQRLMTIPGVGKITAATVRAVVPDATLFKTARHFASWLGITPRSFSSGGKLSYGRISKIGNGELRKLLVIGAFPIVARARGRQSTNEWLYSLVKRKPYKVAAVAIANRTARIVWALVTNGGVCSSTKGFPQPELA
ncbi:hypothetical protein J2X43_005878, partial [Rhizobium sp. BE258]|nr:hypothetical protein [Rhizobium sp. BE258]